MIAVPPWLIQRRVPFTWIPAVLFFGGVAWLPKPIHNEALHNALHAVGYVLILLAVLGRMWAGLTISGRKNKDLCTDGPYSLCRNPLYLFSYLGVLGLSLAAENIVLAGLSTVLFWAYYAVIMKSEEEKLRALFGDAYDAYRRRVPAVVPRLSRCRMRERLDVPRRRKIRVTVDAMWFLGATVLVEALQQLRAVVG